MKRFAERVERDLHHIADRATPSPTAWESVTSRIAEQSDRPEAEIIMLDDETDRPGRTRGNVRLIGAAAAVLLIAGGLFALVRSDTDGESVRSAGEGVSAFELSESVEPDYSAIGDDDRVVIKAFVAAVNSGDIEETMALFGPEAEFGSTMVDTAEGTAPVAELGAVVDEYFRFLADRHAEISIEGCAPDGDQVTCRGWYTDEVVAPIDGYLSGSALGNTLQINFASVDDTLSLVRLNPNLPRGVLVKGFEPGVCPNPCKPTPWVTSAGYLAFLHWIDDTYPDERDLLMDDSLAYATTADPTDDDLVYGAFPNFTPESRALWTARVDEWLATVS